MGDRDEIRRGYDELAETYAARRSESEREGAILDEFLDWLSDPVRVLDAGCGQGTPALRRLCEETTAVGLDISRQQLEITAETVPAARVVHADMTRLPFRNGAFDAVTAFNSLIHVPLSDHQRVVDEFARVLRPGGSVLLSEASDELERTNRDWLDGGVSMRWTMAGAEATREQLREAGFRIVNEWDAPGASAEDGPEPPFFHAQLSV
jgi:ubiquinone/menaquinone biosynthesis C-methylase UbiE